MNRYHPTDFNYPVRVTSEGQFIGEIDVNPKRDSKMSSKKIMRPFIFVIGAQPTTLDEKLEPLQERMQGLSEGNGRK